jgi:hypothetical protein
MLTKTKSDIDILILPFTAKIKNVKGDIGKMES